MLEKANKLLSAIDTISQGGTTLWLVGWNYNGPTAQNNDRFIPYILSIPPPASSCQTQTGPPWTAVARDTACQPHVFRILIWFPLLSVWQFIGGVSLRWYSKNTKLSRTGSFRRRLKWQPMPVRRVAWVICHLQFSTQWAHLRYRHVWQPLLLKGWRTRYL